MGELMHDALGVGLAATQVGVLHRVLVYRTDPEDDRSPRSSIPCSSGRARRPRSREEGCLSLPGVHVEVERPAQVRVRARDAGGAEVVIEAEGLEARVIQHEIDHLDGVLILDRVSRARARRRCAPCARRSRCGAGGGRRRLAGRSGARLTGLRPAAPPSQTVFLGTSDFAAAVLEQLAASVHGRCSSSHVPIVPPAADAGSSSPPVADTARSWLALEQPGSVNEPEIAERIAACRPEVVVLCAFGALVKEPLLSAYEILNVHPSLLPRWRGAAPIERAIMAGDAQTGVSIMRLTAGLDSGPVCLRRQRADRAR